MFWTELSKVLLNAGALAVIGGALYAAIKFFYFYKNRKELRITTRQDAFDKTVQQLSSDNKSSQLSAAILLRRFLGKPVVDIAFSLEKETINVISSLAKTLPTGVFQKTLVDGLAYASDLTRCDLQKTNLQDVLLDNKEHEIIMDETDLFLADLSYANLEGIRGHNIIFYRSILFCTRIKNCDFTNGNFRGADLSGVSFKNVLLAGADFTDAINVPPAIKQRINKETGKFEYNERIDAYHQTQNKNIFFSMPGTITKEDELLIKDYRRTLEKRGYHIIFYRTDDYPRFGQFNRVREGIMHSCAMVAFGLKQLNIEKASFRPGTADENEWVNKWLSTPWSEIEVGMALMQGMPILLVCDPAITNGVFDDNLSECFVAKISTNEDSLKLEQNKQFETWLSKIQ